MSPSRWSPVGMPLLAAAILLSLTTQGSAKISLAAALAVPATVTPKSCSGAFRYAARVGNGDIAALSPVQAFANDRRLTRTRYTARSMYDLEAERSRLHALNAMCGTR